VKASRLASSACRAVNSSGEDAIRSISALIGSLSAEFKWISPRPSAQDMDGHKKEGDIRHASSSRRRIVTDISTPRNLVGKRVKFIVL
jgi:hypothetical protein